MRLTEKEGEALLLAQDPIALGREADAVRRARYGNRTTFIVDRNINYTNICRNECSFCAFYRRLDAADAYLLSYEEMLRLLKREFPMLTIHSFTATEILYFAENAGLSVEETLKRLQAAGLDSLPGGGAEILVDRIRKRIAPKKIMTDDWLRIMKTAHTIGMESTATMVIGFGETMADRIEHMEKVRRLQDETGGFRAFITWTFQPGHTELGGEKTSSWDYLTTLALTRLYLDNIAHIQGSWVTQGERIGQLTLGFGADDLGSIMLEENVVKAAGTRYEMSIQKMVRLIQGAGREAAQRDTEYRVLKTFSERSE